MIPIPYRYYSIFCMPRIRWVGILAVALAAASVLCFWADQEIIEYCRAMQPHIQNHRKLLSIAAKWITLLIPIIAAVIIIGKAPDSKMSIAADAVLLTVATLFISQIIHMIYPRDRPFTDLGVSSLISNDTNPCFPSEHAEFGFAIGVCLFLNCGKSGYLACVVAVIAGLARIVALLNWPSDVMAGALLGTIPPLALTCIRARLASWFGEPG
jgi:membrane-associated phospholipid phosphatase